MTLLSRRDCLRGATLVPVAAALSACHWGDSPLLRVGIHPWPGYEMLHLARELGQLDDKQVRLVQGPSASSTVRALSLNTIEAGCLTLDEVLSARDRGIPLTVVAVFNDSQGADALLARKKLGALSDLRGMRIGVEKSSVGAVVLDAALREAGLQAHQVESVYVAVDEHVKAYRANQLDAIVTYEPHKSQLIRSGAVEVFSTRQTPGLVVDVLAIRTDQLTPFRQSIRHLLDGHFKALAAWQAQPRQHDVFMARRLQIDTQDVSPAFAEIKLLNREENRAWLSDRNSVLQASAQRLADTLLDSGLLTRPAELAGLFSLDAL